MKKILFCLQTMTCGGVEKELITILRKFNPKEYDITVLVLYIQDQKIISEIPEYVHFIDLGIDSDYYFSKTSTKIKKRLQNKDVFDALNVAVKRILKINTYSESIRRIPKLVDVFDIAVCYHVHSTLILIYVADVIQANIKIAWIHSDLYKTNFSIQKLKRYINKYDEVVAVSQRVKEEFDALVPQYQGSSSFAHNILDAKEIYEKSKTAPDERFISDSHCKILTVGRYSSEKGIDQAIECCKMLKDNNIDFHWYFIGWGEEESLYRRLMAEYSLENHVTILGRKDNPYPYMKGCDIYCQPSRHEAWCLTVTEAKILCRPIVCTDFAGADEQIENGVTGIIVPVNNLNLLYEKIKDLILHKEVRERLSENLKKSSNYTNDWENIIKHFT